MATFAEWLSSSREKRNLSQSELAERLGMHVRSISRMETGVGTPNRNNLKRIAAFFGVDPELLLQAMANGAAPPVRDPQQSGIALDFFTTQKLNEVAAEGGVEPGHWLRGLMEWLGNQSPEFRRFVIEGAAKGEPVLDGVTGPITRRSQTGEFERSRAQ